MASINVRIEDKDKILFENFCNNVGMNISTAVNMFVKNVITKQELPFRVENDPFYSEENQKALKESIKQIANGKIVKHDIIEA